MKVTVIGKKHTKFTNNDTKKEVEIFSIFVVHKNPYDDNISQYEGDGCSTINVPENIYKSLNVNQQYIIDFDKKGKILEVDEI